MALPKEIIVMKNKEKSFHERWVEGKDPLNFPHPFRMLLCSIQPNRGKTNCIKNVLVRIDPSFREIYLMHCGEDMQEEYDDIEYKILKEVPAINSGVFDPKVKTLLIVEDRNFKYFNKEEMERFDRILGFVSTHRNLSVICSSQSFFDVPCCFRRMSNVYVLWKTRDLDAMKTIGRRVGLQKEELWNLMQEHLKDPHDSLWLDCTKGTPFPIRKNGYIMIDMPETSCM